MKASNSKGSEFCVSSASPLCGEEMKKTVIIYIRKLLLKEYNTQPTIMYHFVNGQKEKVTQDHIAIKENFWHNDDYYSGDNKEKSFKSQSDSVIARFRKLPIGVKVLIGILIFLFVYYLVGLILYIMVSSNKKEGSGKWNTPEAIEFRKMLYAQQVADMRKRGLCPCPPDN